MRIWRALGLVAASDRLQCHVVGLGDDDRAGRRPVVGAADDVVPSGAPSGTER